MHLCACMSSYSWFSSALRPWYGTEQRPLPWRDTRDPYRIWLSEVILQQTRVDQGMAYYHRFVERWPTVARLAAADEEDVLKAWQGLGYYSRARNLLAAARQVISEFGGKFPDTHAELSRLRGVGAYTAAAIASISFGRPEAVVDGNVYRVLARVFGLDLPIDSTEGRKRFQELATTLLDTTRPGDHNQAVMELGAVICTPHAPRCPECPLQDRCVAHATGRQSTLPVKAGRTKVRERHFLYLHIGGADRVHLRKRTGRDIWQGLYEPPLFETPAPLTTTAIRALLRREFGPGWRTGPVEHSGRQVLSHQHVHHRFLVATPPVGFRPPADWSALTLEEAHRYAVAKPVERWLALLMEARAGGQG